MQELWVAGIWGQTDATGRSIRNVSYYVLGTVPYPLANFSIFELMVSKPGFI